MKILRRYEHIAQKEHFCDWCCKYIQPGDHYEGIVYLNEKRIIVSKQHIYPSCDPDEPDSEKNKLEMTLSNAA